MKLKLRPYQEQGLNLIKTAMSGRIHDAIEYRRGHAGAARKVLYVLPTGGGKTVTYSAIAEGAAAKGNRVLILEHRKELIYQASLALAGLGVPHQVVAPPAKVNEIKRRHVAEHGQPYVRENAQVAVASVQTLARRFDWLDRYRPALVICDEAHHAIAGTWKRISEATEYAMQLGVTATPCRTSGAGLSEVFEAMVIGPTMAELIELGNLVPPRVFAPPLGASLDGVHTKSGDWDAKEMADVLDRPTITGSAVDHYGQLAPGKPAIVFCCNRRHATNVAAEFKAAGWRFEVIDGTLDDGVRDKLIAGLSSGAVQGLVSVDVISEGTDVPAAEVAIMLRATQSLSLYLQQAGRVLRPAPGKSHGLILDHVGNALRHGLPQGDHDWALEGEKKRRRKRGDEEPEDDIKIAQCPKCYQVHEPMPACPHCGHVYETQFSAPKQRDGQLAEIQESEADIQRRKEKMKQGRARTKEELVQQGMSEARADHVIRARREKERQQRELRKLVDNWQAITQRSSVDAWGFNISDIQKMKPKQLRENIEKIGEALFSHSGQLA